MVAFMMGKSLCWGRVHVEQRVLIGQSSSRDKISEGKFLPCVVWGSWKECHGYDGLVRSL